MPARQAAKWGGHESLRLLHGDHTIDGGVLYNLLAPARPMNGQLVNASRTAKAEVQAAIILREIPRSRNAFRNLTAPICDQFYARADSIVIAFGSFECDRQPVIAVLRNVVVRRSLGAQIYDERVHFAVIVVVTE